MWKVSSFCSTDGCVEFGIFQVSTFCAAASCVEIGVWDKSTFSMSNGDCIEVTGITKSSFSAHNGNSLEAAHEGNLVAVRDTKDLSIEPALYSLRAWQHFIGEVKAGKHPVIDGVDEYPLAHLRFTRSEWDAFVRGAQNLDANGRGEFDLSPELELALAGADALA